MIAVPNFDCVSLRKLSPLLLIALVATGCGERSDPEPRDVAGVSATPNRDELPGGLYHDFIDDSRADSAGHPLGAQVFEGERGCSPTTGAVGGEGIAADAGLDEAGVLCQGVTRSLGDGTFTLSARALIGGDDDRELTGAPLLHVRVFDGDEEVASRDVTAADFGEDGVERDLAVTFRHRGDGAVRFQVEWTAATSARLKYVELFRSTPRLIVSPPSQVVDVDEPPRFEIEMQDPPDGVTFEVECDGQDLTPTLDELLASGDAERTETAFRTIVSAPARPLFAECPPPSTVRVRAMVNGWERKTSRVTYLADPVPCAYAPTFNDPDRVRVLVTGFEPFPADSNKDNSSKEAVDAYLAGPHAENVAVMRAILPVEYDTAPRLLEDLIDRCDPDVIIGFGQGRTAVDVETTAYNRKDTASVFGGVPDNRGVIYGGAPIVEEGPAESATALPVEAILAELASLGIESRPSNDPGRYICNNVFYSIMDVVSEDPTRTGGFIHLPRIPDVTDEERETLRQTVATAVEQTVAARTGE